MNIRINKLILNLANLVLLNKVTIYGKVTDNDTKMLAYGININLKS